MEDYQQENKIWVKWSCIHQDNNTGCQQENKIWVKWYCIHQDNNTGCQQEN
jgi:hypothetical protein